MKLDDYSFEFHEERVEICHTQCLCHVPFHYPHILTLLTSNLLLSMITASLSWGIQLSLTYPHIPDEPQINNHQVSYLVSIRLIFVFRCNFLTPK